MKKILTTAVAAVTLAGAVAATATPAAAQHYRGGYGGYHGGYYGGHYHHDNAGPAIAAGVLGLALGAAIANNGHSYYGGGYYGGPYYSDYGYYGPPRLCYSTHWVWDPYIGRRVPMRDSYPC